MNSKRKTKGSFILPIMKLHYRGCLQMFPNPINKLSPKTINPKVLSFGFSSVFLLKLSQNMKNEALNRVSIPRKWCPDFLVRTQYNWTLSTKSWPDFCQTKTPKTCIKLCHGLTKSCPNFRRTSNINFKSITTGVMS